MHAPRGTPQRRDSLRLAAAVTSLLAILAVWSPEANAAPAAPKGPALHLHHDDPLLAPELGQIRIRATTALHDEELVYELEREWRVRQLAAADGMRWAGIGLTVGGGILWAILLPTQISAWAANRREHLECQDSYYDDCYSDSIDFSGFFLLLFGPHAAASLAVGIPLIVAGAVRAHLAAIPEAAPKLRKVGAILAWSSLAVIGAGLTVSFLTANDPYDSAVPLGVLLGSNVCLLGLLLGGSGLAVWAEASRAQELRQVYGFRDHLRWKPAVDRRARARQEATRRAGLPRAYLFTHVFQF